MLDKQDRFVDGLDRDKFELQADGKSAEQQVLACLLWSSPAWKIAAYEYFRGILPFRMGRQGCFAMRLRSPHDFPNTPLAA